MQLISNQEPLAAENSFRHQIGIKLWRFGHHLRAVLAVLACFMVLGAVLAVMATEQDPKTRPEDESGMGQG